MSSWVKVIIQDQQGKEVHSFAAEDHKSFVQMAEDNDIELPVSCCSWACFVCACKIRSWQEHVDIAKLSVPLVDIEEDQVLTCVWWIKSELFSDWWYYEIVLQKLL